MINLQFLYKTILRAFVFAIIASILFFLINTYNYPIILSVFVGILLILLLEGLSVFNFYTVSKKRANEADAILKHFAFLSHDQDKINSLIKKHETLIDELESSGYTICHQDQISMITWFRAFVNLVLMENSSINKKHWNKKIKSIKKQLESVSKDRIKELNIKI